MMAYGDLHLSHFRSRVHHFFQRRYDLLSSSILVLLLRPQASSSSIALQVNPMCPIFNRRIRHISRTRIRTDTLTKMADPCNIDSLI